MRRYLSIAAAVTAVILTGAVPAAASAPPSIHIKARTSEIYMYDDSPNGTGSFHPAANVSGTVVGCQPGEWYIRYASLVQDGVSFAWADGGALGSIEWVCGADKKSPISMSFYGDSLHSGKAVAHFGVAPESGSGVTVEATRTVMIP